MNDTTPLQTPSVEVVTHMALPRLEGFLFLTCIPPVNLLAIWNNFTTNLFPVHPIDITSSTSLNMGSVEVPSRHKALVYDNPGSVSTKIEEVDTPKPGVGEVLVNLTHSGGTSRPILYSHGSGTSVPQSATR